MNNKDLCVRVASSSATAHREWLGVGVWLEALERRILNSSGGKERFGLQE